MRLGALIVYAYHRYGSAYIFAEEEQNISGF